MDKNMRSEALALLFGMLLILVTFEGSHIAWYVGNLDSIFGSGFWPVLDVVYPVASIAVFLLYGWVKGKGLRLKPVPIALFALFLVMLILFTIDDIALVFGASLELPAAYWIMMSIVYPLYALAAFLLFGRANRPKPSAEKQELWKPQPERQESSEPTSAS
ncbi:MAG: hypothetical protein ACE14S_10275 [Candidatus Bathyarchaeia archaeon]